MKKANTPGEGPGEVPTHPKAPDSTSANHKQQGKAAKKVAAKKEAAKKVAAKKEAAKKEAAKKEAAKKEAAKKEAAKKEAAKQEAAKQEAAKQEAAKQEAAEKSRQQQEHPEQRNADSETQGERPTKGEFVIEIVDIDDPNASFEVWDSAGRMIGSATHREGGSVSVPVPDETDYRIVSKSMGNTTQTIGRATRVRRNQ